MNKYETNCGVLVPGLDHGCQIANAGGLNADAQLWFGMRNIAVTNKCEVTPIGLRHIKVRVR